MRRPPTKPIRSWRISLLASWNCLRRRSLTTKIANALRVAVTHQRLSEQDAAAALAHFAQYTIVRYDFTGIASLTFDLSGQYQRSLYDSAYLVLA